MKKQMVRGVLLAAAAVLVALTLAACNSSSSPGIVKGYSKGPITAKGSIFVNGVEYDTSTATISVNGAAATDADLKVGMHVEVSGDIDLATQTGTATDIQYSGSLEGPISAIAGPHLTVLGQLVTVDAGTRYEGVAGLGTLAVADVIEAAGYPDGSGGLLATFIEKKTPAPTTFEIKGLISSIAGQTNSSLTLVPFRGAGTPLTVNFTGTLIGGLLVGFPLEVQFSTYAAGVITTTAGSIELNQELWPAEGDYAEVEGYVSNLAAPHFSLDGMAVDAGSLSLVGISSGTKVEVKGTYSAGVLLASSIEVK